MKLEWFDASSYCYEFYFTEGGEKVWLKVYPQRFRYSFGITFRGMSTIVDRTVVSDLLFKIVSEDRWFRAMVMLMSLLNYKTAYNFSLNIFTKDRAKFEERLLRSIWLSATVQKDLHMVREAMNVIKDYRDCFHTDKLGKYIMKFRDAPMHFKVLVVAREIKRGVKR